MQNKEGLRIYIAGPYSAETETQISQNVTKALDVGLDLWKKGHYPYIPHLTHFVDLRAREKGTPMKWEDYIEWDKVWLEFCDALLFLGNSKGANRELEYAKKLGKTIYYNIDDIPTVSKNRGGRVYDFQK